MVERAKELEAEAEAAAATEAAAQAKRQAEGRKKPGKKAEPPSGEPAAKVQRNFTDLESRVLVIRDGFIQGYHARAAVDARAQVIVAHALTNSQSDQEQLTVLLDGAELAEQATGRPYFWGLGLKRSGQFADVVQRQQKHKGLGDRSGKGPVRPRGPVSEPARSCKSNSPTAATSRHR
jgi:hypothetical protein